MTGGGPHRGRDARPASTVEVVGGIVALGALGAGILALTAHVWPRTATIVVIVSYIVVCWVLARGLAR